MKFGVREICDVVLRAKDRVKIGNQIFDKDEPVIYFDTAKTSTVEGAATTVYATGGKGNSRLIAWEGEKTITFTMEDALISPLGFAILSGAGIVEATSSEKISVHTTSNTVGTVATGAIEIDLAGFLPTNGTLATADAYAFILDSSGSINQKLGKVKPKNNSTVLSFTAPAGATDGQSYTILVDYYISMASGVKQLEITPDKFAGSYYLEASTLFRAQDTGRDMPAQFVIPNVKIQSNFSFAMASTGDPSTFTFTMDAFPGHTKFDSSKQVLFALQIVEDFQLGAAASIENTAPKKEAEPEAAPKSAYNRMN